MYNPLHPPPKPPAFGADTVCPEEQASLLSKLIFGWLSPFLSVGFSRPLEKEDLWQLPEDKTTASLSRQLEHNFFARVAPEKRPASSRPPTADAHDPELSKETSVSEVEEKDVESDSSKAGGAFQPHKVKSTKNDKKKKCKYDESLLKALNQTFFWRWWSAGILKLFSDTLNTTTPLVTKLLLTYLADAYAAHRLSPQQRAEFGLDHVRGLGYGIGLAFALFVMQEGSSLMQNHYYMRTMTVGVLLRTATIGLIFRKSLRLSGRARVEHSVGQITTMISTDTARLDRVGSMAHVLWTSPIQIAIGIGLLIGTLGYSALVGLGVLLLSFPVNAVFIGVMFTQRKKGVKITDKRVRLTNEVLQGIRLIKLYAWEAFYGHQLGALRTAEVQTIRKVAMARALLIASMTFTPILAAILSFITYALSGHTLSVAVIFSSLQLFNIIRVPLAFLPLVFAGAADAVVALQRIARFLLAEELGEPYGVDEEAKDAVVVRGGFVWETAGGQEGVGGGKFEGAGRGKGRGGRGGGRGGGRRLFGRKKKREVLPTTNGGEEGEKTKEKEKEEEKPFELQDVELRIPNGSFVAIVGQVGTGKSSLLQAMIGEMRKTRGEVVFGGSVAYVPQTPWIMNATLKENVLFGQEEDEERFREVIKACCLEHDLDLLPHRENTEIGEKGINLSGGQKARVSLARAAYAQTDIVLLDDSLSAVDAWVGKSILDNCLLNGPLANTTRVLVTHALHVLDKVDYIYVMDDGVIREQGTFNDLMEDSILFSRIMDEYGSLEKEDEEEKAEGKPGKKDVYEKSAIKAESGQAQAALMQVEERVTGAVTMTTYKKYLRYAGGLYWAPFIFTMLTLMQGASVANNLFLGFWTAESIPGFTQGSYMGVYAALGVAQAIFSFATSFSFSLAALAAGLMMFKAALMGVLRSPVSFFDTTPMGRIISRLSKDQDTVDTEVSMTLFQFLSTFSNVIGTVALVFYAFPYLGIIFAPLSILYYSASVYYRRTSVETKRLDSLMRSALYASYTESLTGLSTVRAYREQDRFVRSADNGLDMENRAYYMTVAIQRWLGVRLDLFGNILILGIGLFAAGFRNTVNPSKIGVVLSYSLSITQTLSQMVATYAQNEQNMNAVERILVYTELEPEGEAKTPNDPPPSWPEKGAVSFKNVELAYRPGLPLVLKDISFDVQPGEKIGIVGRTGAGKSSLLQALFRMVELQSGKIEIDGRNIREIGLDTLRSRLALVPQDCTLFLGTLRENIDPESTRTDAELISALRRAWLLPRDGSSDPTAEAKFSLDSPVNDEGGNFSAGEKQLLALCRALVKNSRIIVLDEATSSVDVETDAKIQKTIQTEFSTSTLLCIAHRLNTIVYYDRVLVMDSGKTAEFDTPLNLFDQEGSIFRSLCDEAGLSRQDILRIRAGVPG
ncbi:multidrug resistance-associated ABC transporter [Neolentinus lepideus HHB14362 ss-1]|uniref:Multidrug resistance-associated ABC transporter n=1 Tax=Neolentinus lepideus HHB14362 ss-1 TaxID=1314782 RepID=A0A165VNA5_9AGAM|nr:multidrug resistance-associated ABC transporter [Neolentinus lepideus HHB14362 ss-1]